MNHSSLVHNNLLDYLRTFSGGKEVFTPKQLEAVIGVSAKQQSVLRKDQKMLIPHMELGGKILYSIYAVATFLLPNTPAVLNSQGRSNSDQSSPKGTKKTEHLSKWRAGLKTPSSKPVDMTQALLMSFVITNIDEEIERLQILSRQLSSHQVEIQLENEFDQLSSTSNSPTAKLHTQPF
jgi:hypothetical protein